MGDYGSRRDEHSSPRGSNDGDVNCDWNQEKRHPPIRIFVPERVVVCVAVAVERVDVVRQEIHGVDGQKAAEYGVVVARPEVLHPRVWIQRLAVEPLFVGGSRLENAIAIRSVALAPQQVAGLIGGCQGRARDVVVVIDNLCLSVQA